MIAYESCGDGRLARPGDPSSAAAFLNCPAQNATSSPFPTPPAYSDSEISQPKNLLAPTHPPQSRTFQLSRTASQSCFSLRAMTVPQPPQIHADKLRKVAASLRPRGEP